MDEWINDGSSNTCKVKKTNSHIWVYNPIIHDIWYTVIAITDYFLIHKSHIERSLPNISAQTRRVLVQIASYDHESPRLFKTARKAFLLLTRVFFSGLPMSEKGKRIKKNKQITLGGILNHSAVAAILSTGHLLYDRSTDSESYWNMTSILNTWTRQ